MRIFLWKIQRVALAAVVLLSFCACSKDDYRHAIPRDCTALASVDMSQLTGNRYQLLLKLLLRSSSLEDLGMDLSQRVFLFETADGMLGMCVGMADADQLASTLEKLAAIGGCGQPEERRGYRFTLMAGSWVVGYSDVALLLMGPVAKDGVLEMQNRMARLLAQEEEQGVLGTRIYEKLQSMKGRMNVVAQAQALPEQVVMPFMLGAPQDADASQVYVAAEMSLRDGMLLMDGETFSFNKSVDASLQEASKIYRPIQGRYIPMLDDEAVMAMLVNVEGKDYLKLLQSNRSLQSLLAGVNTAIDMDNILRSVNGEMLVQTTLGQQDEMRMALNAELAHTEWLRDVPYWKQSCPQGARLDDWKENAWHFSNGEQSFYFGVTSDAQFYSGTHESRLLAMLQGVPETSGISPKLAGELKGSRLVMLLNLEPLNRRQEKSAVVTSWLGKIMGDVRYIVYRMK